MKTLTAPQKKAFLNALASANPDGVVSMQDWLHAGPVRSSAALVGAQVVRIEVPGVGPVRLDLMAKIVRDTFKEACGFVYVLGKGWRVLLSASFPGRAGRYWEVIDDGKYVELPYEAVGRQCLWK